MSHLTIKNNICYNSAHFFEGDSFDNGDIPVVEKNLYYGGASNIPPWEHDYVTSDPQFVDAANHDFSLQSSSGARDVGVSIPLVTTDYIGLTRPQGSVYDIGAYEYIEDAIHKTIQLGTGAKTLSFSGTKTLTIQ